MNYQFEYCGNKEYVRLHVTEELIESSFICNTVEGNTESEKQLYILMKRVKGVVETDLRRYTVTFRIGIAFDRDTVLQSGLEYLKIWFVQQGILEEGENLVQLPTLRNDINYHMCEQCVAEQEKLMKETFRDFDTQ